MRKQHGSHGHQVYKKPAESHHHPAKNNDIINTLVTWGIKIADKDHLKQELDHLMKASIKNGYRDKKFKKTIKRANKKERNNNRKKEKQNNNNDTPLAILPYIHGTTNKIARIHRKRDTKVTFSPLNSLRNMIDSAKHHVLRRNYSEESTPSWLAHATRSTSTRLVVRPRQD